MLDFVRLGPVVDSPVLTGVNIAQPEAPETATAMDMHNNLARKPYKSRMKIGTSKSPPQQIKGRSQKGAIVSS